MDFGAILRHEFAMLNLRKIKKNKPRNSILVLKCDKFDAHIKNYKMSGKLTLTMIKPEAVEKGYTGAILNKIEDAGFEISAMKMYRLTRAQVESFYAEHFGKPFYEGLCDYMCSGPIVAAVLKKENAVADFRTLVGKTNPAEAAEGTIRKEFAESGSKNAVHGSDSDESAMKEIGFHFAQTELH
ncbi:MAG: nucleoside-diphosphate kinase [Glaciecola sp.]